MLYCYGRVSTDEQENSFDNQRAKLLAYADKLGLPLGGIFLDEDQSAFSIPLRRRREGAKLWDAIQPGDTVLIPSVDRAFRSNSDAWNTLDLWHSNGVKLVLMDMNIDTSTEDGELVFGIRLSTARYESRMNSRRQREVYAHLRKEGLPYGGLRPFGWVRKGRGWAECQPERETAALIVQMRKDGNSFPKIALELCKANVKKPVVRKNCRPWYYVADVWSLYRAALDGFPMRPQAAWQASRPEAMPPAEGSGDLSQASAV